jgi:hypothetical protein
VWGGRWREGMPAPSANETIDIPPPMMCINNQWREVSGRADKHQNGESEGATPHFPPTPMSKIQRRNQSVPVTVATANSTQNPDGEVRWGFSAAIPP